MKRMVMWAAPLAVAVLGLAACSSSSDDVSPSAGPSAGSSSSSSVAAAEAFLTEASAPVEAADPVGPDFKPVSGKTVGVMSCGQIATPCKRMADAAVEAAKAMGYATILTDGALSPPGYTKAILELVNKKVDLIVASVAAGATVPEAYKAAAAAKIPLICLNCSNAALPADVKAQGNADADTTSQGKQLAYTAIAEAKGDVKAVVYTSTPTTSIKTRIDSAVETLKECSTCKVLETKEIPLVPEQQQVIRGEVTSLLQKYGKGEINYIVGGADFPIIGAIEAIKAAGRTDVKVVSVGCDPQNLDVMRNGGAQTMCTDDPLEWMAWASVDLGGRLLAGQTIKDVLLPAAYVTPTVNMPPAGETARVPDFRTIYKKQWGVS
jgi:ribose transport system substrate-binding protein